MADTDGLARFFAGPVGTSPSPLRFATLAERFDAPSSCPIPPAALASRAIPLPSPFALTPFAMTDSPFNISESFPVAPASVLSPVVLSSSSSLATTAFFDERGKSGWRPARMSARNSRSLMRCSIASFSGSTCSSACSTSAMATSAVAATGAISTDSTISTFSTSTGAGGATTGSRSIARVSTGSSSATGVPSGSMIRENCKMSIKSQHRRIERLAPPA